MNGENIILFNDLTEARGKALEGLTSPHVDTIRGFDITNFYETSAGTFYGEFDDEGKLIVEEFCENFVSFSAAAEQSVFVDVYSTAPTLQYSYNKCIWYDWTITTPITFGISSHPIVYVRGMNSAFSLNGIYNIFKFSTDAPVAVGGNVMALLDWESPSSAITELGCFKQIFMGASALSTVEKTFLPATDITGMIAYMGMFQDCINLTTAPNLPASAVSTGCYSMMFQGCKSLTTAPDLPALTLSGNCYLYMFKGCTSLSAAPNLPATNLVTQCYMGMFSGCTNLTSISCSATTNVTSDCTSGWVASVASAGTFSCIPSAGWVLDSDDGIPFRWSTDFSNESVIFHLSSATVTMPSASTSLYYSFNYADWSATTPSQSITQSFYLRGINNSYIGKFSMSGYVFIDGNSTALLDYTTLPMVIPDGAFKEMFVDCYSLKSISKDFLPATTVGVGSYQDMFVDCHALVIAPDLPATELATGCYANMFLRCVKLTQAPKLSVSTLAIGAYGNLFNGCTSLNEIHCDATDITATICTYNWVVDVASTGDFYGKSAAGWTTGDSGIPEGWTQHLE